MWQIAALSRAAVLAVVLCVTAGPVIGQSESASFRLAQSTTNIGGGDGSSSTSFLLDASLGQELTIGASASPHFVLQSGFWSFLGSGVVPLFLKVKKNSVNVENVDLEWSGNNPPYDVFESPDCEHVIDHRREETNANELLDVHPRPEALVCYNVLDLGPEPGPGQSISPEVPESSKEGIVP